VTPTKTSNYIQYLPNLVATRSRASVCDRSLAGTAGSKRAGGGRGGGGLDACHLWGGGAVGYSFLCRADHSFRGVLPRVVFMSAIVEPRQ